MCSDSECDNICKNCEKQKKFEDLHQNEINFVEDEIPESDTELLTTNNHHNPDSYY